MESKLQYLIFIQSVIERQARNSFLLKGWDITLIAGLFVLATRDSIKQYILLTYFPTIAFWILNGYFLSQERRFRALYDSVRILAPENIDFSMDTERFNVGRNTFEHSLFSRVLLTFYVTLAVSVLIIWFVI